MDKKSYTVEIIFDPQKGHYPVEIELIFLSINSTRLKLWKNGNNAQFNLIGHGSSYKWSWTWQE